jgi:hypothetical protein
MGLYDVLDQIIALLRQRKRLTYRLLQTLLIGYECSACMETYRSHCVGITSWKKGRPGIVRCVGPVGIGANGIVRAVTDVRMVCRCPVNDVAGGYERLSDG